MSISNWGKFNASNVSLNNVSIYGKLNVYNYFDHFIKVNDVEYSFCQENNVTFTEMSSKNSTSRLNSFRLN